ncbi:putative ubiquitin-like putative cysteine protease [Feldmannia species virus]|uniref:Putative ubiquitin-like putative cysteine protease n=1 Tax=Feldmannia species virus TaxID=39420 RepID=B5LWN4_9PHYC|nr:putative ubiquitin-like putative cysteine protease [Feldmannia species virus]ACH46897.1 putative ubiquitin-like putative cysteine protease [Feldmannia species virus]
MVKHCDIPRCYLTKKEDKCLSPNPWILHLIQMSGQGFTRKEISQKYRARKEIVKRRTAHMSPSEAKKLANKNMCADIHAGRIRAKKTQTPRQSFFTDKPVPSTWSWKSISPFEFNHKTNLGGDAYAECSVKFNNNDISLFGPTGWFNDNIIDAYMALLGGSSNPASKQKAYFFNAFFYEYLRHKQSVSGYTNGITTTSHDRIFIPVNVRRNHWILIVVDNGKKKVSCYDSLHRRHIVVLRNIKRWAHSIYGTDDWTTEYGTSPLQLNTDDCGVFVCINAALLSNKRKLKYSQEHMAAFRQRIARSIVNGRL